MFERDNGPTKRQQERAALMADIRCSKRNVPEIPEDANDHDKRVLCVEAGMPGHYNDVQMDSWIDGDKVRGSGITR